MAIPVNDQDGNKSAEILDYNFQWDIRLWSDEASPWELNIWLMFVEDIAYHPEGSNGKEKYGGVLFCVTVKTKGRIRSAHCDDALIGRQSRGRPVAGYLLRTSRRKRGNLRLDLRLAGPLLAPPRRRPRRPRRQTCEDCGRNTLALHFLC